jgi:hypothetical protein
LPTGRRGGGVYDMWRKAKYFDNYSKDYGDEHIVVQIWEHEHSPWIYFYDLDINTYEFTYRTKSYR